MNTNNFISIHQVIGDVYQNPMLDSCPEDYIIKKIVELAGVIGIPSMFIDKDETIEIHNNKGKLPCDFYEVKGVLLDCCYNTCCHSDANIGALEAQKENVQNELNVLLSKPTSSNDKHLIKELEDKLEFITNNIELAKHPSAFKNRVSRNGKAFIARTSNITPMMDDGKGTLDYNIQNGNIYTSIKEGTILMSYKAVAIDDEGYPMIIDNESYKRALISYITVEWYKILLAKGSININSVTLAEQDYQWAIARATSSLRTPTYDEMESLSRILNTLLPQNYHEHSFKNLHSLNTLKTH